MAGPASAASELKAEVGAGAGGGGPVVLAGCMIAVIPCCGIWTSPDPYAQWPSANASRTPSRSPCGNPSCLRGPCIAGRRLAGRPAERPAAHVLLQYPSVRFRELWPVSDAHGHLIGAPKLARPGIGTF